MKIDIVDIKHHDEEALFTKLRQVTLNSYPDVKIYEKSAIDLELNNEQIETLYPCQYYLSKAELMKVRNLNYALKEHDIDMFYLNGYVTITQYNDEIGQRYDIDLLPPVLECILMPNGEYKWLICDGMHRIYLSMLEYTNIQVIAIGKSDTLNEYPYYAYPIPNMLSPGEPAWHEVKIYDTVPEDMIKRWPRIENHKSLYRNFNTVFQGVSGRHIKK